MQYIVGNRAPFVVVVNFFPEADSTSSLDLQMSHAFPGGLRGVGQLKLYKNCFVPFPFSSWWGKLAIKFAF